MKVEYLPADPANGKGLQYILRPEAPNEMRLLTILAEHAVNSDVRLRVTGAERSEKNIPGIPDCPALAVSFTLETKDGTPFVPEGTLNPSLPVRTTATSGREVARGNGAGTKVVSRPGSFVVEEPKRR